MGRTMKKGSPQPRSSGFRREADAGVVIKDLCRKHGFSGGSYSLWRRKFGGMSVSDAQRLKELELENTDARSCWPTRSWRTRRAPPSN